MFNVTGSPAQAFVDAVKAKLTADTRLMALIQGVFGHVSEAARTSYPYVVLGNRERGGDGGAMQLAGGRVMLQLDVWSDHKGPSEVHVIQSWLAFLLERQPLTLSGFSMIHGSLTCELETVVSEADPDNPKAALYHGVQHWVADVEESV